MSKYVIAITKDLDKLANRSEEVNMINSSTREKATKVISELEATLKNHKDIVALTASQIGYKDRIISLKVGEENIFTFVNPILTQNKGLHVVREFNPSIPDHTYLSLRYDYTVVMFQNKNGGIESKELTGKAAEVMHACYDLLEGILPKDMGLELDNDYDTLTDEEKVTLANDYLRHMETMAELNASMIANNEELTNFMKGIEFSEKVANGEVELYEEPKETNDDKEKLC